MPKQISLRSPKHDIIRISLCTIKEAHDQTKQIEFQTKLSLLLETRLDVLTNGLTGWCLDNGENRIAIPSLEASDNGERSIEISGPFFTEWLEGCKNVRT
ncbi:hypothetical protein [Rubritalea sp.]|uniref:hypothetical protein n=1 Tax=Rubritalea sp. TaxID=2109375 RepID=UPI003EF8CEED